MLSGFMIILAIAMVLNVLYKVGKWDFDMSWFGWMQREPSTLAMIERGYQKFGRDAAEFGRGAAEFGQEDIEELVCNMQEFVECSIENEVFKYKDKSVRKR